ncbi:hypothetical protein L484_002310 [Morus notabilis]|uniref:FBD domain-containing protein n=1 Tax=Morus notabilis TaxID=981085 RepID=W9S0P6_9ROSA|nr:hypothetical protein L484_002310 [Morus notabilis]
MIADINILASRKSLELLELHQAEITDEWQLRNLILGGLVVTEKWIKDNLPELTHLENLEVKSCDLRLNTPIKVHLENLKSLEFSSYPRILPSMAIESPNLVVFRYSRKLECFIYPEQVRKTLIPPLYGIKHLETHVSRVVRSRRYLELVDSLLWFTPHPETISFLVRCFLKTTKASIKILQLYYRVPANSVIKEEEDNIITCCPPSPVKCWRHDLTEVAIENFEDHVVRTSLQTYFMANAKAARITLT